MSTLIILGALALLMFVAYRGMSVILFAPVAAMLAVLLTDPVSVPVLFSSVFMEKAAGFIKLYLPVFLLGAVFGKLIDISGFSKSIVAFVFKVIGPKHVIASIVLVCGILTYGGVSLFVVVFAVYPFAAEMFKKGEIPKRLIPATLALGSFTFTMDALPGSPQIQNIIPTTFFGTNTWAAPWLGVLDALLILAFGLTYLNRRRRTASLKGEGYGSDHKLEPEVSAEAPGIHPLLAMLPLFVVFVVNLALTYAIPRFYGDTYETLLPGMDAAIKTEIKSVTAIWAVEGAMLLGILTILVFAYKVVAEKFAQASVAAVSGALLASMNTAAEYGFGAVIAALPGFLLIKNALKSIPNTLINEAVTVTTLAGITGSASGGLSIALAATSKSIIASAQTAGIPMEVLHRVASIACGGMDTLPHNGAIITLLAVTGLTHRQSYGDIFAITCFKTVAVFLVIAFYLVTGIA